MVIDQVRKRYTYGLAGGTSTYTMTFPPASPFRFVRTRYSEVDVQPWAQAAVKEACELEDVDDPIGYIAKLRDVLGPWAFGETAEAAQAELESVLIGWALLKLDDGDSDIPAMGSISFY